MMITATAVGAPTYLSVHAEMFAEIKLTATTVVARHLLVFSRIQENLNYYHPGTQAAGRQAICKIAHLADNEFTTS